MVRRRNGFCPEHYREVLATTQNKSSQRRRPPRLLRLLSRGFLGYVARAAKTAWRPRAPAHLVLSFRVRIRDLRTKSYLNRSGYNLRKPSKRDFRFNYPLLSTSNASPSQMIDGGCYPKDLPGTTEYMKVVLYLSMPPQLSPLSPVALIPSQLLLYCGLLSFPYQMSYYISCSASPRLKSLRGKEKMKGGRGGLVVSLSHTQTHKNQFHTLFFASFSFPLKRQNEFFFF